MRIDKNVPISKKNRGKEKKYTFDKMDIGDSFTINKSEQLSVYSCLKYFNKLNNTAFKIKTGKDDSGQLRCWRVE